MLYKDNLLSSGSCSSSSSSTVKKIDFGLLRPLWKLYYSLLEDLGERVQSVLRTYTLLIYCHTFDDMVECCNACLRFV